MPRYLQPAAHPTPAPSALSSEPTKQLPEWSYRSTVDCPHFLEAWVVDHGYDECQAMVCHALIAEFRSCHCCLLPSALQAKIVICTLSSESRTHMPWPCLLPHDLPGPIGIPPPLCVRGLAVVPPGQAGIYGPGSCALPGQPFACRVHPLISQARFTRPQAMRPYSSVPLG